MSEIGDIIKNKRRDLGLTKLQVVSRVGYKNISKGLNRLNEIECGRKSFPKTSVLARFAALLEIESVEFVLAAQREWNWLDQPVKPQLLEWIKGPVCRSHPLPARCTLDEARAVALASATNNGHVVCLTLSAVRFEYFLPSGKVRRHGSIDPYVRSLEKEHDLQRRHG